MSNQCPTCGSEALYSSSGERPLVQSTAGDSTRLIPCKDDWHIKTAPAKERELFETNVRERIAGGMHGWSLEREGYGYHQGVVHAYWLGWMARSAKKEVMPGAAPEVEKLVQAIKEISERKPCGLSFRTCDSGRDGTGCIGCVARRALADYKNSTKGQQ